MKTLKKGTNRICYFETSPHARQIQKFLSSKICTQLLASLKDTCIVLGGDGTMLAALKRYQSSGYVFLGLHFGRRGFWMTPLAYLTSTTQWKKIAAPALQITQWGNKKIPTKKPLLAFNDIVIKSVGGRSVSCALHTRNQDVDFVGDGVIVATAMGSTAYNAAAGWAILPCESDKLVTTPLVPLEPKEVASRTHKASENIRISWHADDLRPVGIFCDGAPWRPQIATAGKLCIKQGAKIQFLIAQEYFKIFEKKRIQENRRCMRSHE